MLIKPSWWLADRHLWKLILCQLRSPEEAFQNSVECITGPISRVISKDGMPALYNMLDAEGKKVFEQVPVPLAGPVALTMLVGSS